MTRRDVFMRLIGRAPVDGGESWVSKITDMEQSRWKGWTLRAGGPCGMRLKVV